MPQTETQQDPNLVEEAAYFPVPGAHLYTVLHAVAEPAARVLLIGPSSSERHFSYYPWVRWARYLAERRVEVLRFDYRGVGESTGVFEETKFKDWHEDSLLLAEWLSLRTPSVPLVLHGLELGTLLAGKAFESGIGDGLLLWSPRENANQILRTNLMRWASYDQFSLSFKAARPASYFIRRLEEGSCCDVHGYRWSSRHWMESFEFTMPCELNDDGASLAYDRPVRIIKLTKKAAPLVKPFLAYDELKDLGWLYAENFEWIHSVLNDRGK